MVFIFQVSARESLDVVRARQQAEQNARIATHYQSIEDDQTLDADHDGIYEPVDDQHVEKQPVMSPPPLPGDRQVYHALDATPYTMYMPYRRSKHPPPYMYLVTDRYTTP